MQATELWAHGQALLAPCAEAFTYWGFQRFTEWVTGLVLNVEEHSITQSLIGLDRAKDWKALESFTEYGAWDQEVLERATATEIDRAPHRRWYGYRVWVIDDSKVHRASPDVWGTCTFHEYTARCPNRASTVRAPNWVVIGALLPRSCQPACFLPHTGRVYFRRSQLPPGESFQTKCALLVDLARREAAHVAGDHLAIFDGAFAVRSVVRPRTRPEPGQPSVECLTRLRQDARLYARLPAVRPPGRRGPRPKWGRRLAAPRPGGRWPGRWQQGQAWMYGRWRQVCYQEVECLWAVAGPQVLVKAVVAHGEGYRKRFTIISSACELSGLQLIELFAARFRQEDTFRDLKQRLGWEECRAWTKNPILRTAQLQLLALTWLRLLQFRLEEAAGDSWWFHPPWQKRKARPSVLDLERLWWQHREEIQRLLAAAVGT